MQAWKSELERLLRSTGDRDAGVVIQEICDLAAEMGDDAAEALLEHHPDLFELAKPLVQANLQRFEEQNISEAQRLLAQQWDEPVSFAAVAGADSVRIYERLGNMFGVVDFSDCHCLVMVGCGRVPFTNFHLHDKTKVPEIIGLDIRPEAVEMANTLAAWLGYDRIRAELADGCLYDYGRAQIVFVTNYVLRKSVILSRIADTAPENVQIVVREPYSLGRLWAEDCKLASEPRLEVIARGSGWSQLSRGFCLKRRRTSRSR